MKETGLKALTEIPQQLKISHPSRKTKKAIAKTAKALRTDLKAAMKNQMKKATKPSGSRKAKPGVAVA